MKKIILVFIAFFVFASCKEDNSISNENEYIFAYLLNSKSDFISIIGTKDNNDNLQEINKLNLNGNKYPLDIDYIYSDYQYNKHFAIISFSGEEVNSDNYGKIWGTNSSNKILIYEDLNGNLFQEIQLEKIAYSIQWINNDMMLVGQSGENESSILTYSYSPRDNDGFFLKEEFKLNGSLTEFLYTNNKLVCYFPNEGKLKVYNLFTKELLKEIILEGKPKTVSIRQFDYGELGILDIKNQKVNVLNLENLSYVNILNLDFVPSDFVFMKNYNEISSLDDNYLFISNPIDGNILRFIKTNETWAQSGFLSTNNKISNLDIPNCSSSIFYAINTINNSLIYIDPFGFNKIKNIPFTGNSPTKLAFSCIK